MSDRRKIRVVAEINVGTMPDEMIDAIIKALENGRSGGLISIERVGDEVPPLEITEGRQLSTLQQEILIGMLGGGAESFSRQTIAAMVKPGRAPVQAGETIAPTLTRLKARRYVDNPRRGVHRLTELGRMVAERLKEHSEESDAMVAAEMDLERERREQRTKSRAA